MIGLFSIDNNYDQPNNNLVCLWEKKPTLEELCKAFGHSTLPTKNTELLVKIIKVWDGESQMIDCADYDLRKVKFGEILE